MHNRRLHSCLLLALFLSAQSSPSFGGSRKEVNTIRDLVARLRSCWQPPAVSQARPIRMTLLVSFTRFGDILGRPRITYESEEADDQDRLAYRLAAMNALKRCTPIPFTDAMGNAIAGRPLRLTVSGKPLPERTLPSRADCKPVVTTASHRPS